MSTNKDRSIGPHEHTLKWLNASVATAKTNHKTLEGEHDKGIATQLYISSQESFEELHRQCYQKWSTRQSSNLREEITKLYLWGEAFRDGELDVALRQSHDARCTVLSILIDMGQSVMQGTRT